MSYKILTTSNIEHYLLSLRDIALFFNGAPLRIEEIGDGNLNFVFLVTSTQECSRQLIVKQAVPYLRCAGESYPLSQERMIYEIRSLKHFATLCDHIPTIYYSDERMSVLIMEYLADHALMRKGMINANIYPHAATHLGTFLAHTLFKTSTLSLSSHEHHHLIAQFIGNKELCKLTEDFVFTAPFMEHETNADLPELTDLAHEIAADIPLKMHILTLKHLFMNRSDALLHGDLHTGSIMLNRHTTYVIDSEFAFMGPMGFDIGTLIANFVMSYVAHGVHGNTQYQQWILSSIQTFWSTFETAFRTLWQATPHNALMAQGFASPELLKQYQDAYMLQLFQESIGFAGCEILRRQFGIAGVEDIRGIADARLREYANRHAVALGRRFINAYLHVKNSEDIIMLIKASHAG